MKRRLCWGLDIGRAWPRPMPLMASMDQKSPENAGAGGTAPLGSWRGSRFLMLISGCSMNPKGRLVSCTSASVTTTLNQTDIGMATFYHMNCIKNAWPNDSKHSKLAIGNYHNTARPPARGFAASAAGNSSSQTCCLQDVSHMQNARFPVGISSCPASI